ncbi:MAG: AbrB/MazE/SpoVT family DNA-binding domain-containing protein [Ardenticatenaceae bacterium]
MSIVNTRIVKIGNSQGIRIPKVLLEQSGLGEHVGLEVQPGQIIIRAAQHPRQGWEEQFRLMAEQGDDRLLDGETLSLTKWEEEEWEW